MSSLRLVDPAQLSPEQEAAWDRLGCKAEAHPVFAEPWFMRQSLAHCVGSDIVTLAIVEDDAGEWMGMIPLSRALRHGRAPMPNVRAWYHPNQFQVSPLVRKGSAEAFWRILLEGVERHYPGRIALGLQCLSLNDPATRALREVCRDQRRILSFDRSFERAILSAAKGAQVPDIAAKHKARIRSLESKIERDLGPLRLSVTRDPQVIANQVPVFLQIERSGWKGQRGSALTCDQQTEAFFRAVVEAGGRNEALELAQIHAGERPIAMTTLLVGAHGCYGFKMAFDQEFARYGPGLVLMARYTRSLVEREVGLVDSCSAPNQQPISRLWPERVQLVDLCVALNGPIRGFAFRSMLALEGLHKRVVRGASPSDVRLTAVGG